MGLLVNHQELIFYCCMRSYIFYYFKNNNNRMTKRKQSKGKGKSGSKNNSDKSSDKTTLAGNVFNTGSSKSVGDFVAISNFLINKIKQYPEGNDIATALEKLQEFDFTGLKPNRQRSQDADEGNRKFEQETFDMEFESANEIYNKRMNQHRQNKDRAYAFLWGQCAKGMQSKIKSRKDYESVIKNNPIELLKAIKEHSMSYQENRCDMAQVYKALQDYINIKQKDDEDLVDCTARFKAAKDVLVGILDGPLVVQSAVRKHGGFIVGATTDAELQTNSDIMDEVFGRLSAYIFLHRSDQAKCGTVTHNLNEQQSLDNDQYPKTIRTAVNVLSNHRFDEAYVEKKRKQRRRQTDKDTTEDDDKDKKVEEVSFAQLEGKCYVCGKPKCRSNKCPLRETTPKKDWAINKVAAKEQLHAIVTTTPTTDATAQAGSVRSQDTSTTQSDTASVTTQGTTQGTSHAQVWCYGMAQFTLQQQRHPVPDMKKVIVLDTGSSDNLFANKDLMDNVRPGPHSIGMTTNAGEIVTNVRGDIGIFGQAWQEDSAATNVLALSKVADKHRVTYDSAIEDAFNIHTPRKIMKFKRSVNDVYVYDPYNPTVNMVQTVAENMEFYTPRQIARAKRAREFLQATGPPTVKDLRTIVRTNIMADCPVTEEDIALAEDIFGPDIGSIKGKTVRKKPLPVVHDYIEIPPELKLKHRKVTLCMDTCFVNEIPFLNTISRHIMYRTTNELENRTVASYRSALDDVFGKYNAAGFTIGCIHCDIEFKPVMDKIKAALKIRMIYAGKGEHVPEAERNNRVTKERCRSSFHNLPYNLPKPLVGPLVETSTEKLNYFPPKGGVSSHFSPHMILTNEKLHYRQFQLPFGSYVLAHDEPNPTNTPQARAKDCIYIRTHLRGGHEVFDIHTKRIINRPHVTPIPITPSVINAMNQMAEDDGMKGLIVKSRTGQILWNSAWIAGVDYDEDEDDDDYTQSSESDNDESDDESSQCDEIDPEELDDILDDGNEDNANPNDSNDNDDDSSTSSNGSNDAEPNDNEGIDMTHPEEEIVFAEDSSDDEADPVPDPNVRRSTRVRSHPREHGDYEPSLTGQSYAHLHSQTGETVEYDSDMGRVAAKTIDKLNCIMMLANEHGLSFLETYSLKKAKKKFPDRALPAAHKEWKQLHDRVCFVPIDVKSLSAEEKRKAIESFIFFVEKKSGVLKGREVIMGNRQRVWMDKQESSSPTVMTDSVMISSSIDAHEERYVATADVPNAFIQTKLPDKDPHGDRYTMKITGEMVDFLLELAPEIYSPFVTYENGRKVIYVIVKKAIYGMLQSALLFYKQWRKDLEASGFVVNPYDPCVANKIVDGKQITVLWHVDDLKASHVKKAVVDSFIDWVKKHCGTIGEVKVTTGDRHPYVGFTLDYSVKGEVKVDMVDYVEDMIKTYPKPLKGTSVNLSSEKLFQVDKQSPKLSQEEKEQFHTIVAKALFLSKRARPDIQPAVAFLCTRVQEPTVQDWKKLHRMMSFLKKTKEDCLTLAINPEQKIEWYVDAAFAVHPDMKGHTGAVMTMGKGAMISMSCKQRSNARSSTEAELIGVDDAMSRILWTLKFLAAQDFKVNDCVLHQDNKSAIQLENNGRLSAGKRTRHLDIKLFFVADCVDKGCMRIEYCPTDLMVADYESKALVGKKFRKHRGTIMNLKRTVEQSS